MREIWDWWVEEYRRAGGSIYLLVWIVAVSMWITWLLVLFVPLVASALTGFDQRTIVRGCLTLGVLPDCPE